MASFDPYLHWLGIRSPERPPNHYRLLGIEPFESDAGVIETAADRQMAHVRTFQNGKDAELSQQILNQLAAAKICLLDGKTKFEYDTALKEKYFNEPPPVDPETISVTPSGSRVIEIDDTPEVAIDVEDEGSFQLSRPKRGSRSSGIRKLAIGSVVGIAVLALVAITVGPVQNWFAGNVEPSDDVTASPDAEDSLTPNQELPSGTDAQDKSDTDLNDSSSDSEPPGEPPVEPPTDLPAEKPADNDESASEAKVANRGDVRSDSSLATQTENISPSLNQPSMFWDEPIERHPFVPQHSSELEPFVIAIANRDVDSAEMILDSMDAGQTMRALSAKRLRPIVQAHEQFWEAHEEATGELRMATKLKYRGEIVQVIGRTQTTIRFKKSDGATQTLATNPDDIDLDLAIALVRLRYSANPVVAWRLIGVLLAVDRGGNFPLAMEVLRLAGQGGASTSADERALIFLASAAGTPEFSTEDRHLNSQPEQPAVDSAPLLSIKRNPVPGKNASRAARKLVGENFASFANNRTEQGKTILVAELLAAAKKEENARRPVYTFALLESAKQVGSEIERDDLVLQAIIETARLYDIDLKAEITGAFDANGLAESARTIVETTTECGDELLSDGDYELATQLAEIANDYSSSAPEVADRVVILRERIQQAKSIATAASEAQGAIRSDAQDPQANQAIGLHHLVLREFSIGLPFLVRGDNILLQEVAMADLTASDSNRPNHTLADQWTAVSEEYEGIVRARMLARAKYWLGQ
ncbi:MAG: hypothetical protein KDB27_20930 [Planctomycetales bacterium]|nr:hypothetical protein [Planctomycetales bacterium]